MKNIEQLALIPEAFRTARDSLPAEPEIIQSKIDKRKAASISRRIVNPKTYRDFYNEGRQLSSDIEGDADKKTDLLIKYFGRRFGNEGVQPIMGEDCAYVGTLFKKMMDYAEKTRHQ